MATGPRKLSSNDVAALVGGLMDEGAGRTVENGLDVRPFAFGSNDLALQGDYYALRMINERFCRTARDVFLPMLRILPRISSFPPEIRSFDDYRSSQENFLSLTNSRIEELRGNQLIVLPPSFISLLTDAYYGGTIEHRKATRAEFTATEQRVIELVSDRLNEALRIAWRDLMLLQFTVTGREENMQFAAFVDGDDMVVICSFMVQLPGNEPASFDILYPLQTLKPIASQLRSRTQSDVVDDDLSWRDRLEQAILDVPLTLTARLCERELPLHRLMNRHEALVVPMTVTDRVEVRIADRPMFEATQGDVGGQSALNILRRLSG